MSNYIFQIINIIRSQIKGHLFDLKGHIYNTGILATIKFVCDANNTQEKTAN